MESLGTVPWLTEAIIGLSIVNCLLFLIGLKYLVGIHRKLRQYRFLSKNGEDKDLESILLNISEQVRFTAQNLNKLEERFVTHLVKAQKHLQHQGLVRFQAFPNIGGDQSFGLALLDGDGNGIVLSSIFGRDESRIYCKPVEKGKSSYTLSKEEQQAIDLALTTTGTGEKSNHFLNSKKL